jgi:hypothetical protein
MSFQTQNQACQQLTDAVDKEYKNMADSIKETAEKIKVQLGLVHSRCNFLFLCFDPSFFPFAGQVQAEHGRDKVIHIAWYFEFLTTIFHPNSALLLARINT